MEFSKDYTADRVQQKFSYVLLRFGIIANTLAVIALKDNPIDAKHYLLYVNLLLAIACLLSVVVMYFLKHIKRYTLKILEFLAISYSFGLIVCCGLYHFDAEVAYLALCTFITVFTVFSSKRMLQCHLLINVLMMVIMAAVNYNSAKIDLIRYFFSAFCFSLPIYWAFLNRINTRKSYQTSQNSLIQSEERFKNIFENAPIGIVLLDRLYNIVRLNKRFVSISGYTDEKLFELTPDKLIHPDDWVSPNTIVQKILKSPLKYYSTELRLIRKNQEILWLRMTATCVDIDGEANSHLLLMLEDISVQKEAEEKLRAYALKLADQNKALEEFSYVISHDLQEPLRMITVYTQLLQQRYISRIPDADAQTNMGFVIEGSKRMSQLIKDMLEYARWTTKDMPKEVVGTNEVLLEVIKNLTIAMKYSHASIVSDTLPTLHTNRMLLGQVLQNIIGNSLKYAHPERNPIINIWSNVNDVETTMTIEDNGIGFNTKDSDRIFGIFQRLHGRTSEYQGTGIGLAICKRIIEKQGGKIWAEGTLGEGAKFSFSVPNIDQK